MSKNNRVALTPAGVKVLEDQGHQVVIEADAGLRAGRLDADYLAVGAEVAPTRADLISRVDLIATIRLGSAGGLDTAFPAETVRSGQVIVGLLDPLTDPQSAQALAERGVTALSLDLLPRTTRAQEMDVLSSQANLAGYKAVLLAADSLDRIMPMMITAAGTLKPAKVLILGAGVAGLQAIATAKRLGAVVSAYDIRPAVKEEVESVGGTFLEVETPPEATGGEGSGQYAKELDADAQARQREMLANAVAGSDIVITTAAVPGRKAPILMDEEMVQSMRPGACIVDLASDRGGNVESSAPNEVVMVEGVKVIGPVDLPAAVPDHASQMFSHNLTRYLGHVTTPEGLQEDEDGILMATMVTRDGAILPSAVRDRLTEVGP